jgi:hypothetical protein
VGAGDVRPAAVDFDGGGLAGALQLPRPRQVAAVFQAPLQRGPPPGRGDPKQVGVERGRAGPVALRQTTLQRGLELQRSSLGPKAFRLPKLAGIPSAVALGELQGGVVIPQAQSQLVRGTERLGPRGPRSLPQARASREPPFRKSPRRSARLTRPGSGRYVRAPGAKSPTAR